MKKILVVRLSSLGDIVLAQPVLEQIARQGGSVDLLVRPEYASLAKMLPGVGRAVTAPADFEPSYDLVLDLHATGRSQRAMRRARTKKLIRYHKKSLARRLLVRWQGRHWPWNFLSSLTEHEWVPDWYSQAAIRAGYNQPKAWPRIECDEAQTIAIQQTLERIGIQSEDRIVVLAPGAKWATKQWPQENFSQVAAGLQAVAGCIPVFIGSAAERSLCEQASRAAGGRAVSLAGLLNLPMLGALLARAELLLANDSGPMHLGLAAGCRVLAFFGPTVPQFGFAPLAHPNATILMKDLPCRPCSLHGSPACPLKHHACLRGITPEQALAACREILATGRPRARVDARHA